jgi:hypothetical protein
MKELKAKKVAILTYLRDAIKVHSIAIYYKGQELNYPIDRLLKNDQIADKMIRQIEEKIQEEYR